jgi:hypothetical protein
MGSVGDRRALVAGAAGRCGQPDPARGLAAQVRVPPPNAVADASALRREARHSEIPGIWNGLGGESAQPHRCTNWGC